MISLNFLLILGASGAVCSSHFRTFLRGKQQEILQSSQQLQLPEIGTCARIVACIGEDGSIIPPCCLNNKSKILICK